MQDKGTYKIIHVITIRTSGIIPDRVKRTDWATQDFEDIQDNTEQEDSTRTKGQEDRQD
jgi:hypothetical protein